MKIKGLKHPRQHKLITVYQLPINYGKPLLVCNKIFKFTNALQKFDAKIVFNLGFSKSALYNTYFIPNSKGGIKNNLKLGLE